MSLKVHESESKEGISENCEVEADGQETAEMETKNISALFSC